MHHRRLHDDPAVGRFDDDAGIDEVVADLVDLGLVDRRDAALELTARGSRLQQRAAAQVDRVRTDVAAALGDDGYRRLVQLLATVVEALSDGPECNGA